MSGQVRVYVDNPEGDRLAVLVWNYSHEKKPEIVVTPNFPFGHYKLQILERQLRKFCEEHTYKSGSHYDGFAFRAKIAALCNELKFTFTSYGESQRYPISWNTADNFFPGAGMFWDAMWRWKRDIGPSVELYTSHNTKTLWAHQIDPEGKWAITPSWQYVPVRWLREGNTGGWFEHPGYPRLATLSFVDLNNEYFSQLRNYPPHPNVIYKDTNTELIRHLAILIKDRPALEAAYKHLGFDIKDQT